MLLRAHHRRLERVAIMRTVWLLLIAMLAAFAAAQEAPASPPASVDEADAPVEEETLAGAAADADPVDDAVEAEEEEEEEPAPAAPPPPPPVKAKTSFTKSKAAPRSAVGQSLLSSKVGKVPTVALVGVAVLGGLGIALGSGGGAAAVAVPAVAAALSEELEAPAPAPVSDELWLDRQIDKFIALIKVLLGR